MTTWTIRRRKGQSARIDELEKRLAEAQAAIDRRDAEITRGISERNRLHVELAALKGAYNPRPLPPPPDPE